MQSDCPIECSCLADDFWRWSLASYILCYCCILRFVSQPATTRCIRLKILLRLNFHNRNVVPAAPFAKPFGDGDCAADFDGYFDGSEACFEGGEYVGELAKPNVKQILSSLRRLDAGAAGGRGRSKDRSTNSIWVGEEDPAHAIVGECVDVFSQAQAPLSEGGEHAAALECHTALEPVEPIHGRSPGDVCDLAYGKVDIEIGIALLENQMVGTRVDQPSEGGRLDAEVGCTPEVADFISE